VDEAETISRTLLLAQRTADTAIADAEADAKRIREEADAEARYAVDSAREAQNRLIEEAKSEAAAPGKAHASRSRARSSHCWPAVSSCSAMWIISSSTSSPTVIVCARWPERSAISSIAFPAVWPISAAR